MRIKIERNLELFDSVLIWKQSEDILYLQISTKEKYPK